MLHFSDLGPCNDVIKWRGKKNNYKGVTQGHGSEQRSSPLATPLPLSPSLPLVAVYNSSTLLLTRLGCRRVEELQKGGRERGGVARGLLL